MVVLLIVKAQITSIVNKTLGNKIKFGKFNCINLACEVQNTL